MRTLLRVKMTDVQAGNKALVENKIGGILGKLTDKIHPEAAYYFAENGCRSALFVFDLKDTSQIPSIVEPLFTQLNAETELLPVMNAEELSKGIEAWNRAK